MRFCTNKPEAFLVKLFFFIVLTTSGNVYAQSGHLKCAPNCVYFGTSTEKNAVSCIDRVCKSCYEKQEAERKERLKEEKIAEQRRIQEEEKRKQAQIKQREEQQKQIALKRQREKEKEDALIAAREKKVVTNQPQPQAVQQTASSDFDENIKSYVDGSTGTFGLKIGDKLIASHPYPKGATSASISRIFQTNYFCVKFRTTKISDDWIQMYSIMAPNGQLVTISGHKEFFNSGSMYDRNGNVIVNSGIKPGNGYYEIIHLEGSFSKGHSVVTDGDGLNKFAYANSSDLIDAHEYSVSRNPKSSMLWWYLYTAECSIIKVDKNFKLIDKKPGVTYMYVQR